jgi:hypothetical protein
MEAEYYETYEPDEDEASRLYELSGAVDYLILDIEEMLEDEKLDELLNNGEKI